MDIIKYNCKDLIISYFTISFYEYKILKRRIKYLHIK